LNSVVFSSASVHWSTPHDLYEALHAEFAFDYDPCPLQSLTDGLVGDWTGKRVYCNPPYGPGIRRFLEKGAVEPDLAVFLLPARTDTKWFHELVLPLAKEVRFLRGRLKFGEAKNGAPFPSMLAIYRF
jgi:hypothetical protein